jgi:ankyrin repeat protein
MIIFILLIVLCFLLFSFYKYAKEKYEQYFFQRVSLPVMLHAWCSGDIEALEICLKENKLSIHLVKFFDGATPLHIACISSQMDMVRYMIEYKKVDVNVRDNYGETPLHESCRKGNIGLVVYLVENGCADVHAKNDYGETPLHWACLKGHTSVVIYLVENGCADINAKNNGGQTPLFWACRFYNVSIIRYLVEKCNATYDDTFYKVNFRKEIIEYLLSHQLYGLKTVSKWRGL